VGIWLNIFVVLHFKTCFPFLSPLNGAFFVNGYLLSLRGLLPADKNAPKLLVCDASCTPRERLPKGLPILLAPTFDNRYSRLMQFFSD